MKHTVLNDLVQTLLGSVRMIRIDLGKEGSTVLIRFPPRVDAARGRVRVVYSVEGLVTKT